MAFREPNLPVSRFEVFRTETEQNEHFCCFAFSCRTNISPPGTTPRWNQQSRTSELQRQRSTRRSSRILSPLSSLRLILRFSLPNGSSKETG